MSNEVTESEFINYAIKCGLPKKYCNRNASLKLKSRIGERLYEALHKFDNRKLFFEDHKILNLYSEDSAEADGYVALCIRQLLLAGTQAVYIDAYELAKQAPKDDESDLITDLTHNAVYRGLSNFDFMQSEEWPLTSQDLWSLRAKIMEHMNLGRIIITSSSTPVKKIKCYPSSFTNYLVKNTKDVNLDAGN